MESTDGIFFASTDDKTGETQQIELKISPKDFVQQLIFMFPEENFADIIYPIKNNSTRTSEQCTVNDNSLNYHMSASYEGSSDCMPSKESVKESCYSPPKSTKLVEIPLYESDDDQDTIRKVSPIMPNSIPSYQKLNYSEELHLKRKYHAISPEQKNSMEDLQQQTEQSHRFNCGTTISKNQQPNEFELLYVQELEVFKKKALDKAKLQHQQWVKDRKTLQNIVKEVISS